MIRFLTSIHSDSLLHLKLYSPSAIFVIDARDESVPLTASIFDWYKLPWFDRCFICGFFSFSLGYVLHIYFSIYSCIESYVGEKTKGKTRQSKECPHMTGRIKIYVSCIRESHART